MFNHREVLSKKKPTLFADYDDYTSIASPIVIDSSAMQKIEYAYALHDKAITSIDISSNYFKNGAFAKAETYSHQSLRDATIALEIFEKYPAKLGMRKSCSKLIEASKQNLEIIKATSLAEPKDELVESTPSSPPRTIDNSHENHVTPVKAAKPSSTQISPMKYMHTKNKRTDTSENTHITKKIRLFGPKEEDVVQTEQPSPVSEFKL